MKKITKSYTLYSFTELEHYAKERAIENYQELAMELLVDRRENEMKESLDSNLEFSHYKDAMEKIHRSEGGQFYGELSSHAVGAALVKLHPKEEHIDLIEDILTAGAATIHVMESGRVAIYNVPHAEFLMSLKAERKSGDFGRILRRAHTRAEDLIKKDLNQISEQYALATCITEYIFSKEFTEAGILYEYGDEEVFLERGTFFN